MFDCVVSRDEVFVVTVCPEDSSRKPIQLVCRVGDLDEDVEENEDRDFDEENDIDIPDCYRGRITAETVGPVLCLN